MAGNFGLHYCTFKGILEYCTITFSKNNRSGRLTSLFILFTGPQRIPGVEQLITEHDWNYIVHTIIANYDKSNLRFPIQKFFLGKKDRLKKFLGALFWN